MENSEWGAAGSPAEVPQVMHDPAVVHFAARISSPAQDPPPTTNERDGRREEKCVGRYF